MTDIIATLRPTQGIQCEQSILYLFDQNVANSIVETTTRQWLEDNAQQYITEYIQPILDAYEQDKEREIDAYVEEKQSTIFFDNTNLTGTTTAEVLNVTNSASFNDVTLTGSINTSTAIFTDVIKMRASVSFKGAVAPSWSGIGIYELNDDDSVSLMASMEKIDGFTPANNNTYNIGVNSRKWKDLYLAGKAYIPTINNGADISVPSVGGTMALTSDIAIGKNNITNCITEIPQDIKLELNNGTLTLKAGSKVYDGNGLFAEVQTDSSIPNAGYNGQVVIIYTSINAITTAFMGDSVASLPSPSSSYKVYYNTTDKKCYLDAGYWLEVSFPIALATSTITEFTSIDQVFNGFGYVGSTVFALPDVEGLIPNGRNEDGSLKNIEFTTDRVLTFTYTSDNPRNIYFLINGTQCTIDQSYYYDEDKNLNISLADNSIHNLCAIAVYNNRGGKVNNFNSKTPFHAVDYNDTEFIGRQAMPSNRRVDLTLGASGAGYTAPADGYFCLSKQSAGTQSQWANLINSNTNTRISSTSQNGVYVYLFIPARKGDIIYCFYALSGTTEFFRFSYAEGSK